ncbi:sodium:proton antiporter [Pontibacillus halophilus JSM 076056 = DSM 19796]|uniref:Sodium:proton antiporter n=1 Tax=Pontibacillus halophilus JSM 076056 = DSM 19796 TaxID=1385510 RepID=A0A0A5GM34_9BACI|nr:Na+/H+ antiporter NhaC [Pontibacillus halophilus]KGX93004.1 sodium:proton antiporter [Pontibacillus halophilus JSM 076056 = DSM 19796]
MKREPTIGQALLPLIALIGAAACSIFFWKVGMYIPFTIGIIASALVGKRLGYTWNELQQFLTNGVSKALPAIFILLIIGTIVGTWILSGTIPTLIYYGLEIIQPNFFLPTVVVTSGIVAITLGSSFTAIATIGLAFMAIGTSLGFSPAHIAGAIISGAFFGDKLSPLSDTTNIAPAMVDVDLFDHVKHMLWDTIPAFVLSIIAFWILGLNTTSGDFNTSQIDTILSGLNNVFVIHPLLLLLPVLTIVLMARRVPAIPALVVVSTIGGLVALLVQGNTISEVMQAMTNGFVAETGNSTVDDLLSNGGIQSMFSTVALVTFATALGGIMEGIQVFDVLIKRLIKGVRSTGSLISTTLLSTFFVSFVSGAMYLAIILPSKAFLGTYKERGVSATNLSRNVEAAGTVGVNLVPWGVPAVFVSGLMDISPYAFIPFIFFAYFVLLINVIYGYTGFTITKEEPAVQQEDEQWNYPKTV